MGWDEKTFAKFVYLNDIKISKNAERIAYVLTKADLDENKYSRTVVVEDLSSGVKRFVSDSVMPRFSPDGKRLTVVRKGSDGKKSQIYLIDLESTSEMKLVEMKSVIDVVWNDDGRRLAILGHKRLEDEDFYFEDDIPVWFDSMGFLDSEKRIALVFDTLAMETLKELELDRFSSVVWHGDSLVCTSPHRENGKLNPWRYDITLYNGEKSEKLFENVSLRAAHSSGERLVLLGKERAEFLSEHNFVHVWDGQRLKNLTGRLDRDNLLAKIDGEGRVYFTCAEGGRITLKLVDGEEIVDVFTENAFVTDFDVSESGTVVFLAQTEYRPDEIYIWNGEKVKKISDYNSEVLKTIPTREANHFSFDSNGLTIDGWYMEPEIEEGKKAPVVVFVHGGPKGMYGHRFVYMMQHLVDTGFYVVYFNPRGSNGYSEDFALRVLKRTGLEDFQDIMNGLKEFLKLQPKADEKRIGITGISYGGFMTNWAITQTDVFGAAVSENGVSNWRSMYGFSDISLWFVKEVVGENPWKDENYEKLSPFFHVSEVKTPVLLIHSLEDYRCPLDQSVMFYHALKDLGKEAYIAIFKKGAHGHSLYGSPRHRAKRHKLIVEFFKRKLLEDKEGFPVKEIIKSSKE